MTDKGSDNAGVVLDDGSALHARGSGEIVGVGVGGSGKRRNDGVLITRSSEIVSENGAIELNGLPNTF